MAIAVVDSGTQVSTVDTEHTLATSTTGKTYVFVINGGSMQIGDYMRVEMATKPLSGSTSTTAYVAHFAHVQSEPVKYSVPVPANNEIKVVMVHMAGTAQSWEWALLSLD